MRAAYVFVFILLIGSVVSAQDTIAFRRAAHLRRGINVSEWFAQEPGRYTAERLSTYTDVNDIALIKKLGFDHIRLSVDPEPLMDPLVRNPQSQGSNTFLSALDRIVQAAQSKGLAVIIDIHPQSEYKRRVREEYGFVDKFADLWRALAKHYGNLNPDLTFFEVMNEPEFTDPYQWMGMQAHLVAAIRSVAPQNTIVVSGARWSDIDQLLVLEAIADPNLIYNFHFYTPHYFTHQGAIWSSNIEFHLTKGVHYPSQPSQAAQLRVEVPTPLEKYEITKYAFDNWNADRIASEIDIAADWAKERHVPLTCNEFGVYRNYSNPDERAAWIRDVRGILEKEGIGWTMWDYRGGFGVVHKQDGQPAVPDPAIVRALGLDH
jgi:aryl-phospho-beta-D-glucosidase BglC (GH1 family)